MTMSWSEAADIDMAGPPLTDKEIVMAGINSLLTQYHKALILVSDLGTQLVEKLNKETGMSPHPSSQQPPMASESLAGLHAIYSEVLSEMTPVWQKVIGESAMQIHNPEQYHKVGTITKLQLTESSKAFSSVS